MAQRMNPRQRRAMFARMGLLREAAKRLSSETKKQTYERCVKKVKRKNAAETGSESEPVNPWAVCTVSTGYRKRKR